MTHVLIVESDTTAIIQQLKAHQRPSAAEIYSNVLRHYDEAVTLRIIRPYQHSMSESDLNGIHGVAFTGSSVAWSVDASQAAPLRDVMRQAFNKQIPTFGSCNGMQLAATLLGGQSAPSPNGFEVGLANNIQRTNAGKTHPMLQGRTDGYNVPAVHRDEVTHLPEHATRLAGNAHSAIQAFCYQHEGVDFWGTQYHPELSAEQLGHLVRLGSGLFTEYGHLADQLITAEHEETSAQALGSSLAELAIEQRSIELGNWLAYIRAKNNPV